MNSIFKNPYLLSLVCLAGFAGNSVLCRLAIKTNLIDPSLFTALRIGAAIVILLGIHLISEAPKLHIKQINKLHLIASLLLFAYAILLSFAYRSLPTGEGALLLFAAVQVSILVCAVLAKESISLKNWLGNGLSFFALAILLNSTRGDVESSVNNLAFQDHLLMISSGIAWGLYTVIGRNSQSAITDTTINFTLCIPWILLTLAFAYGNDNFNIHWNGAFYAIVSGTITTAITYTVWYAILPNLSSAYSAASQMSVPLIAALGGIFFVGESITLAFSLSFIVLCIGILLSKN